MTGSLNIRAVRAEFKDESITGPSYCLLSIGDSHLHSQIDKKGGRNPEWNELFHFDLSGSEIIFNIKIYKEKYFSKNHLVAEGSTELWNLVDSHKTERWIPLILNTITVGKILVQSEFVPLIGPNPDITLQHKESFIQAYKKKLMDMYHSKKDKPSESSNMNQASETVKSKDKSMSSMNTSAPISTAMTSKSQTKDMPKSTMSKDLPKSTTDTAPIMKSKDSSDIMTSKALQKGSKTTKIMEAFITKMVDKLDIHSKGTEVDKTGKVKSHSHDAKHHHLHHVHDKASSEAQKPMDIKKEVYPASSGKTSTSNMNLIDFS